MGFRDDNDGAEKVGREGAKDDVPAWPDDAAAEEDGNECLGTARSISCWENSRAESDCRYDIRAGAVSGNGD